EVEGEYVPGLIAPFLPCDREPHGLNAEMGSAWGELIIRIGEDVDSGTAGTGIAVAIAGGRLSPQNFATVAHGLIEVMMRSQERFVTGIQGTGRVIRGDPEVQVAAHGGSHAVIRRDEVVERVVDRPTERILGIAERGKTGIGTAAVIEVQVI